jgi:hypothetical protein
MADFDTGSALGDMGAGLLGAGGALLGDIFGGADREEQLRKYREMQRLYQGIPVEMRAEQEGVEALGPSAFEGLTEDPALRQQQMATMQALQDIYSQGGLDLQARADIAEAQAASAQNERAQRGAILEDFARRGGGSGNQALLAALSAQQGNANRAGMESMRGAADAQARAFQALAASGQLAGQVRGQDYGAMSDKARAADIVAQYNAQNRQGVQGRNADRRYMAQRDTTDNRFRQADGQAGALDRQAGYYQSEEDRKRRLGYGIGSAVGRGLGTAAGFIGGGG